jgi:hypothetical protein
MKVWITKYALTKKIIEAEAEERGTNFMVITGKSAWNWTYYNIFC